MAETPKEIKEKLGLVQVYTGKGKGKTTASLGLGFRAAARNINVLMIQFLKPASDYGEHIAVEKFDNFTIKPLGSNRFVNNPSEDDKKEAKIILDKAKEEIYSNKYGLVILDEINVAMHFNLIAPEDVIDILKNRPENIEIVMTGRGAPDKIIEYADLVTEMKQIKHPFEKGISARKGIEY